MNDIYTYVEENVNWHNALCTDRDMVDGIPEFVNRKRNYPDASMFSVLSSGCTMQEVSDYIDSHNICIQKYCLDRPKTHDFGNIIVSKLSLYLQMSDIQKEGLLNVLYQYELITSCTKKTASCMKKQIRVYIEENDLKKPGYISHVTTSVQEAINIHFRH